MRMRAARKRSSLAAGADIRTTGIVQLDASRPPKRPRCDDCSFADNDSNQDRQAAAAETAAEAAAAAAAAAPAAEATLAAEKIQSSSPRVEQQLETEIQNPERETIGRRQDDGERSCEEQDAPALVEESAAAEKKPKNLRHFSRNKQQSGARAPDQTASPQQKKPAERRRRKKAEQQEVEIKPENSDVSSTSPETKNMKNNDMEDNNNNSNNNSNSNNNDEVKNRPNQGKSRYSLRHTYVDFDEVPAELRYFEEDFEDDIPEKKTKSRRKKKQQTQETEKSRTRINKGKMEIIEECLNFLEQMGLFKPSDDRDECVIDVVHPGSVGDGKLTQICRVCGRAENTTSTLVCDTCEETYHLSCCYPKVRSVPRDDRWFCGFCIRKRKKKTAELKVFPAGQFEERLPASWKIDKTKIRGWDLQQRTQVRVGDEFQAVVPEWRGEEAYDDLRSDYPGLEVPRSYADKKREKDHAVRTLASNAWPMGWQPANSLPDNERENWLQCQNILYEEGDCLPTGDVATRDILCGKWRRAPLDIVADDGWECSCAVAWDPRHADCAVPQEISTEEIRKRPKARMQSPAEELKNSGRRGRASQSMVD